MKAVLFHLLVRRHPFTNILFQYHFTTSSRILKLFMDLGMSMHKYEMYKENSSYDCGFPGSSVILPLHWEHNIYIYMENKFVSNHCNIDISEFFWKPYGHFLTLAFIGSYRFQIGSNRIGLGTGTGK